MRLAACVAALAASWIAVCEVDAGTIEGRVTLTGDSGNPAKLFIIKDREVCGKVDLFDDRLIVGPTGGIRDAVIRLNGVPGTHSLAALGDRFEIDQTGCTYVPHVIVAPVDSTVRFLNSDGILHNVHTYCAENVPVNIAQPAFQRVITKRFPKPERVQLRCDIHGWMSGWVVVAEHPFYAVTDAEGSFRLEGVPAGTYSATSWQELLGEREATVTVSPAGTAELNFVYEKK